MISCLEAEIITTGLEHPVVTTKQGYFQYCQGRCYKDKGAGPKELPLTKVNQSDPSEQKILTLVTSVKGQEFTTIIKRE